MSTHGHLTAIRESLESYFGGPITEGNPNAMPAGFDILHHVEELAAELEAERDFEHAEFNLMTRSWEQAQAALEAERARVARLRDGVYSLIAYAERHGVSREAMYTDVLSETFEHGDLPDEEATL